MADELCCTSTSTDPDGSIVSWDWDFSDGGTSSEASSCYTYAAPGTYTVTLTVTDDDGASTACGQDIVVGPAAVTVSIPLSEGWHMISLPLEPVNKNVLIDRETRQVDPDSIFANCLPDNDPRDRLFRMEPGFGYWVYNPTLYPCEAWYEIGVEPPPRDPTPMCPDPIPYPGPWWQGFWFYVASPQGATITYEAYPLSMESMVRFLDLNRNFAPGTFANGWMLFGACARMPELSPWNPDVSTWPLTNTVTDMMWGKSTPPTQPAAWLPSSYCGGPDAWDLGYIGLPIVGYWPGISYYSVSPPAGAPPNYCGSPADTRYLTPGECYWLDVEDPCVWVRVWADQWP